ncbi:hypothetical protein [Metallosphaera hakonensis]|uniref:hypothetical protein n=1 Tax=Metallosphaera hakonensis TaxID=79601 RepID=UPI0011B2676A|nr:hypothetical protein [Metallosphaera hakonensis]QIJ32930.1 hypothetical protein DFR87_13135 [Metallosphaera hakonensis JCM 8857 = DSM 7519]
MSYHFIFYAIQTVKNFVELLAYSFFIFDSNNNLIVAYGYLLISEREADEILKVLEDLRVQIDSLRADKY